MALIDSIAARGILAIYDMDCSGGSWITPHCGWRVGGWRVEGNKRHPVFRLVRLRTRESRPLSGVYSVRRLISSCVQFENA